MSRDTRNLTRLDSGIFQVEWALPKDVQALVGKRTWRRSTGTRDPRKAADIRDAVMVDWRAEVERLRNPTVVERLIGKVKVPADWPGTEEDFLRDIVAAPGEEDGPLTAGELIRTYVDYAKGMMAASRVVHELAGVPFSQERWSVFFREAERMLAFANDQDELLAKLLKAPEQRPTMVDSNSVAVSVAFERWKQNEKPTSTTASAYGVMVRRFIEANGDINVADVGRGHVREFRDRLETHVKSSGTVKNLLSKLSALLNWSSKEGYRSGDNPVKGFGPTKKALPEKKKAPFNCDDVNAVLKYLANTYRVTEDRFWIFPVALLTGMRAEEVCSLRASDVRKIEGVWCIDVNREGGKFVKNDASVRIVPVHETLIKLGFLEHVKRAEENGQLFPTLQKNDKGRYSGYWLNHINHVLHKQLGFGSDKSFHSTRHSFQDRMRDAGIEVTLRDRLFGHSEGGGKRIAARYGAGHSIAVLNEGLQKITYPGVDWSVLQVS